MAEAVLVLVRISFWLPKKSQPRFSEKQRPKGPTSFPEPFFRLGGEAGKGPGNEVGLLEKCPGNEAGKRQK